MSLFVYVDNSNVWLEGCRFSAVRRGMARSFVDAQAQGITDNDWRIDYGKLHQAISDGNAIEKASLFGSTPPESDTLWSLFRSKGWEVKTYPRNFANKEKEVDVAIAGRMIQDAYTRMDKTRGDRAVLLSGDRDHTPAVEILTEAGIPTLVVFWEDSTSPVLRNMASDFFPLDSIFDHISLSVV